MLVTTSYDANSSLEAVTKQFLVRIILCEYSRSQLVVYIPLRDIKYSINWRGIGESISQEVYLV